MTKRNTTKKSESAENSNLRIKLYNIIFKADTPAAKGFDIALLWAIVLSVFAVMLESVQSINQAIGIFLRGIEWFFTILFTIEYILRIITSPRPFKYIFSFLGIIDFLATIPTYIGLFVVGSQYLIVMRTIRLLRVFRIFKLTRFLGEANVLMRALIASKYKITVFLGAVVSIVIIMGTIMYLIEGSNGTSNGFTSIPKSIYWAIVTLTTVGYGDIAPKTVLGQAIALFIMITGYAIIAVPTGIVTVELANATKQQQTNCPRCQHDKHESDAVYCKKCGKKLK